ncbi:50S ribosomal protein L25 [Buchnera aphidicola (Cinara tujafilina)]|uniref:50S ribosomal protein L25 n=1 Tax=Buchnera aphidicola (Cinara tujafilina) TaxID=261317 RepID=F7WZ31_9GAMM|nr:50S ribosomal protein L25 [Buchnera aphidicola]AEH39681.1 50S ribosomal protein L25 [Buchnera aphidicola (Cinara tujafilina)]
MITLNAIQRYNCGTGYSRRLRKIYHQLPGIIYGVNLIKKPLLISLIHDKVFYLQEKNEFYSEDLLLIVNKNKFFVRVKEIQRHAFKLNILHIDFISIKI